MPNYYGREGAPMLQPTKGALRATIREQNDQIHALESLVRSERNSRLKAEQKLVVAAQLIGEQVIERAIKESSAESDVAGRPQVSAFRRF